MSHQVELQVLRQPRFTARQEVGPVGRSTGITQGMVPTLPAPYQDEGDDAAVVPFSGCSSVGEPIEQRMARLRSDRVAHSRKQIWTKDAHGGPYKKVNINQGIDPLVQLPDGSQRKVDLGYERVKVGPTSNFVGNHMTQGAIDLVQAQLEPPTAASLLQLDARGHQAPQLLPHATGGEQRGPPPPRHHPLQRYSWMDAGRTILLELGVQQMELVGGGSRATLTCTFEKDAMDLLVAVGSQAGGDANGSGGTDEQRDRAVCYRLLLRPLYAHVVPGCCSCYVKGALELPPCRAEADGGNGGTCSIERQSGQLRHRISFTLPPSADTVVVQLIKADEQLRWGTLQASLPLAPRQADNAPPDLATLRKMVRQKLNRAPPPTLAIHAAIAGSAAQEVPVPQGTGSATEQAGGTADKGLTLQAALEEAEALVAVGRHAEVLDASDAFVATMRPPLPPAQREAVVKLHVLRGHSHDQLGGLKQAVAEYSAAIQLALAEAEQEHGKPRQQVVDGRGGGGETLLCQLLLARSVLYEQQERLEDALSDVLEAARLQQPTAPTVLLAAQRLRQACQWAGTAPVT